MCPSTPSITANFKETQIGLMRTGQPVSVRVDKLKGETLHGVMDSFSPGTGGQFALIPPNNATGNFTKIVQRVPALLDRRRFALWARTQALTFSPPHGQKPVFQRTTVQVFSQVVFLSSRDLGLGLNAFVMIKTAFEKHQEFEDALRAHPAVIDCYTTAGDSDYILHLVANGVEGLDLLLRREISRLPGVQRSSSTICLTTIKEHGPLMALPPLRP